MGAFKVGAQLTPADGKSYKVTYAQVVGSNMSVFIESPQLDGNAYGYPKTLKTATTTSGTPATVPGTTTGSTGSSSSGSNSSNNSGSATPAATAPVVEVKLPPEPQLGIHRLYHAAAGSRGRADGIERYACQQRQAQSAGAELLGCRLCASDASRGSSTSTTSCRARPTFSSGAPRACG